jgi:cytochrome b6-f complex iron-sulfur subunit
MMTGGTMNESVKRTAGGMTDQPLTRRNFLVYYLLIGFSALATAGGVLAPILSYLWPPKNGAGASSGPVAVASTADLPVGKGSVYSVNNKPVIVIHLADGYKALSAVCTHLNCIVAWDSARQVIACPCHEALFTTNGAVISGPAPTPLQTFQVQVQGDQIYVEGGA